MSLLDIIVKFFKGLTKTEPVQNNKTIHAPISETTPEQRAAMYEHNLKIVSADEIYNDGRYDQMVKIYRSRLDKTKKWDADLAREAAIEVLGKDGYYSLDSFEQGSLLSNIEHGKVDTA